MIKALTSDVSRVLLFPKDKSYKGGLNPLYKEHMYSEDFDFFTYFKINTELLDFYKDLKKNLQIYILTSDIIQTDPKLQPYWEPVIDGIFSAADMPTDKTNPKTYAYLTSKLGVTPTNVVYVDDNAQNIEAANTIGLITILHENNHDTIEKINRLLAQE